MDVVKRNTDYALRAMVSLVQHRENEPVSSKEVAQQGQIPYQLACKLMQKLHSAKLVESFMGPKGGFRLSKNPAKISLLEVVEAIQGPVRLNKCVLGKNVCPQQQRCKVRGKLSELEQSINSYLVSVTLDELVKSSAPGSEGQHDKGRKK